ncbi:molybdopterin converting factor subunit 1 [Bacillaceae bacterium IKA-2]|nr:molybdopterin converting factor subunit 1 [Bacillaceae bacterium IKA-2]
MIKVLFFAELEEIVGSREIIIDQSQMSVNEVKEYLKAKFPTLAVDRAMVAVNEEYAEDADLVKKDDVVAFIPPVSGG